MGRSPVRRYGGTLLRDDRLALAAVLAAAFVLRLAAVAVWREDLSTDPDAYAGHAARLAAGEGYVAPGGSPTAYRPPLYPLLLAGVSPFGRAGVAALQIALGLGTVWLTWRLGSRLGLGRWSLLAAAVVAVDPLLLRYTPQVMTEVTCAFLAALLLWAIGETEGKRSEPDRRRLAFVTGAVFGLAALSRPTFWAFGVLAAAAWGWCRITKRPGRPRLMPPDPASLASSPSPPLSPSPPFLLALGTALTLAPWAVRNAIELGLPVVTTTHGGYTLLLANNPVFSREVVFGPDAAWGGESLAAWQRGLEAEMAADRVADAGEVARDRWMRDRAVETIRRRPTDFVRACVYRIGRLWAVAPVGSPEGSGVVRVAVGMFYAVMFGLASAGLVRLGLGLRTPKTADRLPSWRPAFLLIAAFTAVHAVYWTDARMRAPLVPAVALLAARGLAGGLLGRQSGPRT